MAKIEKLVLKEEKKRAASEGRAARSPSLLPRGSGSGKSLDKSRGDMTQSLDLDSSVGDGGGSLDISVAGSEAH